MTQTAITITLDDVLAAAAGHPNGCPAGAISHSAALCDDPPVTSRGAVSICALRRDGEWIGYAVWSCARQGWVAGSWRHPLTWGEAVRAERRIPWAG